MSGWSTPAAGPAMRWTDSDDAVRGRRRNLVGARRDCHRT